MSELEESVVRSLILMMARNHDKKHVLKRVLKKISEMHEEIINAQ